MQNSALEDEYLLTLLGESIPAQPAALLVDAAGLAQLLNLSAKTVRRMELTGRLPRPVRIGRAVRWRRAEVLAWIEAGCPPRDEWTWRPRN